MRRGSLSVEYIVYELIYAYDNSAGDLPQAPQGDKNLEVFKKYNPGEAFCPILPSFLLPAQPHTAKDKIRHPGRSLRRKFHREMIRNKGSVLGECFGPLSAQKHHGA